MRLLAVALVACAACRHPRTAYCLTGEYGCADIETEAFGARMRGLKTSSPLAFAFRNHCRSGTRASCYEFMITRDGTVDYSGPDALGRPANDTWAIPPDAVHTLVSHAAALQHSRVSPADTCTGSFGKRSNCLFFNGLASCYSGFDRELCAFVNELHDVSGVSGWGTDLDTECPMNWALESTQLPEQPFSTAHPH